MQCSSCRTIGDYHENSMGDKCCNKCGQWHNAAGQPLNSPDNWGEETGEQFNMFGEPMGELEW